MGNAETILALETEKTQLNNEYRQIVMNRNRTFAKYDKQMQEIGAKVKEINAKIYNIKHPEGEDN